MPQLLSASTDWDAAQLSDVIGRAVRLADPVAGEPSIFDMDVDPEDGTAAVVELRTPPGSFFDSRSTLHLLTTAEPRRQRRPPVPPEPPRRLATAPFPEDAWVGRTIRFGGRRRGARSASGRGAASSSPDPSPAVAKDVSVYRDLVRDRAGDLGVYVDARTAGTVAPGDPVELVDA